MLRVLGIL